MWGDRWGQPWGAGHEHEEDIHGLHRVEGTSQFELYLGRDGPPDFTAAPDATSATLPIVHALPLPGKWGRPWGKKWGNAGNTLDYEATCRERNAYGIVGLNQYTRHFIIDSNGNQVTPDPSAPENVTLYDGNTLTVLVVADYYRWADGSNNADYWDLYVRSNGTDPDPGGDSPVSQAMVLVEPFEHLRYSLGPYAAGADVRVILRARRNSDSADDGNTTVHQHDVTAVPAAPGYALVFGGAVNEHR